MFRRVTLLILALATVAGASLTHTSAEPASAARAAPARSALLFGEYCNLELGNGTQSTFAFSSGSTGAKQTAAPDSEPADELSVFSRLAGETVDDTVPPQQKGKWWGWWSEPPYECSADITWTSQDGSNLSVEAQMMNPPVGSDWASCTITPNQPTMYCNPNEDGTSGPTMWLTAEVVGWPTLYDCVLRVHNQTTYTVSSGVNPGQGASHSSGLTVNVQPGGVEQLSDTIGGAGNGGTWDYRSATGCSISTPYSFETGGECYDDAYGEICTDQESGSVQIQVSAGPSGNVATCTSSASLACSITTTSPDDTTLSGVWADVTITDPTGRATAARHRAAAKAAAITGTAKGDTIAGSGLGDRIVAGAGHDRVDGGDGDDTIYGGTGDDIVTGGPGTDMLLGGRGADTVRSGNGNDWIAGGPGNDLLLGGAGTDRIAGGPGDDVIVSRDGDRDEVWCGSGYDIAYADADDAVVGCEMVYHHAPARALARERMARPLAPADLPGAGWKGIGSVTAELSAAQLGRQLRSCETAAAASPADAVSSAWARGGRGLVHVQVTAARHRSDAAAAGVLDGSSVSCIARKLHAQVTPLPISLPGASNAWRLTAGTGKERITVDLAAASRSRTSIVAIFTTVGAPPRADAEAQILAHASARAR